MRDARCVRQMILSATNHNRSKQQQLNDNDDDASFILLLFTLKKKRFCIDVDGPEVHRHGLIFLLAGVCVCMLCPPRQHLFSYYPFFTLLMVLCQLFIVQSLRCFLFSLLRFLSKFFFFQPLFSQFFFEILLFFLVAVIIKNRLSHFLWLSWRNNKKMEIKWCRPNAAMCCRVIYRSI